VSAISDRICSTTVLRLCPLLGLLLLAGCSLLGSDDRAEIRFVIPPAGLLADNALTLRVGEGPPALTVTSGDFRPAEQTTTGYATPPYETATCGTLGVSFELQTPGGQQVATGHFDVDLRADWRWNVILQAGSAERDPTEGCLGCLGYRAFAVEENAGGAAGVDSIYVVLGGNYISDPVIY
jgi:hypothetical protein